MGVHQLRKYLPLEYYVLQMIIREEAPVDLGLRFNWQELQDLQETLVFHITENIDKIFKDKRDSQIFMLYYISQYNQAEIAKMLELNQSTISRRLNGTHHAEPNIINILKDWAKQDKTSNDIIQNIHAKLDLL